MLILLLLAGIAMPSAQAQEPSVSVFSYELEFEKTLIDVPINGKAQVNWVFTDHSRDDLQGFNPGAPRTALSPHKVRVSAEPLEETPGWRFYTVGGFTSYAGKQYFGFIEFQAPNQVRDRHFILNVTFEAEDLRTGHIETLSALIHARTVGLVNFNAYIAGGYDDVLSPRQVVQPGVIVKNNALDPRAFSMELQENPCNLNVVLSRGHVIPPGQTTQMNLAIEAPDDRLWYFNDDCSITVSVYPVDEPSRVIMVPLTVQINGGYMDPMWVVWTLVASTLAALLILYALRRKERLDEEILGKPQKPWTIPIEKVYLERLREEDERAWYLVRNYLMVEEYKSSMAWYHAYKKATKGQRKKERMIIKQEHAYENWQDGWDMRIEKPLAKADRFEAKLQNKLERISRKRFRRARRRWAAARSGVELAQKRLDRRAELDWRLAKKMAAKTGTPPPPKPEPPRFEMPPKPQRETIPLAGHRWQKRADRYRARMDRRAMRIETRYDRADERHLAKLRRKVKRVARRLDDDEFLQEHPLLTGTQ